jgi:hypothetical protein
MPNIGKLLLILHITPLSSRAWKECPDKCDYRCRVHRPRSCALFSASIAARGACVCHLAQPVTRESAPATEASMFAPRNEWNDWKPRTIWCTMISASLHINSQSSYPQHGSIFSLCCNVVCYVSYDGCYNTNLYGAPIFSVVQRGSNNLINTLCTFSFHCETRACKVVGLVLSFYFF